MLTQNVNQWTAFFIKKCLLQNKNISRISGFFSNSKNCELCSNLNARLLYEVDFKQLYCILGTEVIDIKTSIENVEQQQKLFFIQDKKPAQEFQICELQSQPPNLSDMVGVINDPNTFCKERRQHVLQRQLGRKGKAKVRA